MCSFQLQAVNIFDCLGQEMLNFPEQVFLFVILVEIPVVRAFAVMFTGLFKKTKCKYYCISNIWQSENSPLS